jgi:hypothetical protein
MEKKTVIIAVLIITAALILVGYLISREQKSTSAEESEREVAICEPLLDSEGPRYSNSYGEYKGEVKTYTDKELGFSFDYPAEMSIMNGQRIENWVIVQYPESTKDVRRAVVVSVGSNENDMTPEQWLWGPNSGYPDQKEYYGYCHRTRIGGQDAVYTREGMWVVVNIPNTKYRLSIADLTSEGLERPYQAMGVVIGSLKFALK